MLRSRFHRDLSVARATLLADSAPGSPCAGQGHRLIMLHAADSAWSLQAFLSARTPCWQPAQMEVWRQPSRARRRWLAQALQFPSVPVGRGSIRSAKEANTGLSSKWIDLIYEVQAPCHCNDGPSHHQHYHDASSPSAVLVVCVNSFFCQVAGRLAGWAADNCSTEQGQVHLRIANA